MDTRSLDNGSCRAINARISTYLAALLKILCGFGIKITKTTIRQTKMCL